MSERISRAQRDAILAVLKQRFDAKIERWTHLDAERAIDIKASSVEASAMLIEILDAMVEPGHKLDAAARNVLTAVVDPDSESTETNRYLFKQMCLRHGILLGEPISSALRKLQAVPGGGGESSATGGGQ